MGASQSSSSGNNSILSKDDIDKAAKAGQQLIIDQQVSKDLSNIMSVIDSFKKDDFRGLSDYIKQINISLSNKDGQQEKVEVLSKNITDALEQHHKALVYSISTGSHDDRMNNAVKVVNDKTGEYQNHLMMNKDKTYAEVIKSTKDFYTKEFDEKINTILQNPDMKDNELIVKNVKNVGNVIKEMKVKYKYFEYKYVQLNIFMIVLLQHMFTTMEALHTNTLKYNKQRDDLRIQATEQCFGIITELLNRANITLTDEDDMKFTNALVSLEKSVEMQQKKLDEEITRITQSSEKATSELLHQLSEASKVPFTPPGNGDAINARMGMTAAERFRQQGGFPRGGVRLDPPPKKKMR